ncbi:hypothetical protein BHM03_00021709 [Ensete ventricosum]|nr:hypothetical protein BHM03_00021709 [Ensete ventricosum]
MVSAEKEEGEKEIEEEDPTSLSLNNLDPSPPSFAKISPPPCLRRRLLIRVGRRSLDNVTNAWRGRKVILHASSWLLVFAYSLLTLRKHPKCALLALS